MLVDKVKEYFTINREVADKQKSILLLTTIFSALGLGAVAVLDATGVITDDAAPADNAVDNLINPE